MIDKSIDVPRFTLRLEEGQNIGLTDGAFHVPDDRAL